MAEEMRMYSSAQPGGLSVALHHLLYPADRIRSTPLRLKQVNLLRVGREVCPENQAENLWKQDVAVLALLTLVKENLAGGEVKGDKTRFQDFTPLGTWLTIVPFEGIGFSKGKTSCLSAFLPVPNEPSFSWDKVGGSAHV